MSGRVRTAAVALVAAAVVAGTGGSVRAAAAAPAPPPPPAQDPFYAYTGATPLSHVPSGTVLKTRTTSYNLAGVPTPIAVVQLLYRSTDARGRAEANVTSVLLPPQPGAATKLVAYGSIYDSLNRDDEPSYTFAGAPPSIGRTLPTAETGLIAPLLLGGDVVSVADTEGQRADFAAGPEYGTLTLDGLRAALRSPAVGIAPGAKLALAGYSGGAIATGWAAALAPRYAPDIDRRLVGAALGGLLVDPDHNLHYIEGSSVWAGVAAMAIVGAARGYGADVSPYLTPYGRQVVAQVSDASIAQVLGEYPGLTWQQVVKPRWPTPESLPLFVRLANRLILGRTGLPDVPLQIYQGTDGTLEGTPPSPAYGAGDGVMVAGDVRTFAREVCAAGTTVSYEENGVLSHTPGAVAWAIDAVPWLAGRFDAQPTADDCGQIAAGNPLDPVPAPAG